MSFSRRYLSKYMLKKKNAKNKMGESAPAFKEKKKRCKKKVGECAPAPI